MNHIRTGKTAAPTKHLDKKFGMKRTANKATRGLEKKVEDETDYLSSTRSNREHLDRSIADIREGKNMIEVN